MLSSRYLAALLLALPFAAAAEPPMTCLVARIADGDTLTARCGAPGDYQQVKVRLAEIDAPEKAQPFGERSRQALATMCAGEQAVLRPTATDRYGRTVARVECRGKDANAELVRTGMTWPCTRYQTDPTFPLLERQPRAARAGIRGARHGRRAGASLGVAQCHARRGHMRDSLPGKTIVSKRMFM